MHTMRLKDVNQEVVLHVIAALGEKFHTKDVSEHPEMLAAHHSFTGGRNYHATVGKVLRRLAKRDEFRLKYLGGTGGPGARWRRLNDSDVATTPQLPSSEQHPAKQSEPLPYEPVREKHFRAVRFMGTPEFLRIKRLFEAYPVCGGVYFQPTDKGIIPKDLHEASPKPLIGIGHRNRQAIRPGASIGEVERTMENRIAALERNRASAHRSPEKQFEAHVIREAQTNHLLIPGFPDDFRFVHSQWRIEKPGRNDRGGKGYQGFTDIAAVNLTAQSLVLIELKPKRDSTAKGQVADYVRYFQAHAAVLEPFFLEVARMMGMLYDCRELAGLAGLSVAPEGLVAWQEKGHIVVPGLPALYR
jgi:hypothetical protein